jgi:hypothetical protein
MGKELPLDYLIDELFVLDKTIKELGAKKEAKLAELKLLDLPSGTHVGNDGAVTISDVATVKLNPEKVYNNLKLPQFLSVITIVKERCKLYMGDELIDICSEEPVFTKKYSFKARR